MNQLLTNLQAEYPLLKVLDPAEVIEADFLKAKVVSQEWQPVITEYVTRYMLVSHSTMKGDVGTEARKNTLHNDMLRDKILSRFPFNRLIMPYAGYIMTIKTNDDAEYTSKKIKFTFHENPFRADQEAAKP